MECQCPFCKLSRETDHIARIREHSQTPEYATQLKDVLGVTGEIADNPKAAATAAGAGALEVFTCATELMSRAMVAEEHGYTPLELVSPSQLKQFCTMAIGMVIMLDAMKMLDLDAGKQLTERLSMMNDERGTHGSHRLQ